MEKYLNQFEDCRQKEEPACVNACPFHLDVRDFQDKVGRNKYDRAYKRYRDAVVFPEIVSRLCQAPCQEACPRKGYDGPVQLKLLERTCVAKAKKKEPARYNLPKKQQKIAVIGAGLSGLACALRLASKKYEVVVFERERILGGQLKDFMSEKEYLAAIQLQMSKEEYQLITGMEITTLDQLVGQSFQAVYIATGKNGRNFGATENSGYEYDERRGFALWRGGALKGKDVVTAIVDGTNAAAAIELYLKTGKGDITEEQRVARMVPNLDKIKEHGPVSPTDHGVFSDEEAAEEAGRCVKCQCDVCWSHCDLVSYYNKWPSKMREEVVETVMESGSMLRKSPAVYLANTCTQCGLFEHDCPANIDMKGMMLETRRILHKQQQMPPAFHGFWLDDMEHANGASSAVCRNAPGSEWSKYAFFPGCNMGASQPEYVEKAYGWLNENFDNMGLLIRCCGIHAQWAGDEQLRKRLLRDFQGDWERLGRPVLIAACPSCLRFLKEALSEIECVSLYEFICQQGKLPEGIVKNNIKGDILAVFDPCAARENHGMRDAVRKLLRLSAVEAMELEQEGSYGCCGFGGDVAVASPDFADYVAQKRVAMSQAPYLTYCINCRDVFVDKNKAAVHMLDILFDIESRRETPDFSERRKNRELLKKKLLSAYWNEEMPTEENKYGFILTVSEDARKKMRRLRLVEDDIKEVIARARRLNRRVYDEASGTYTCYAKLNYITCWVSYTMEQNAYHLTNVYIHRMDIKLEDVWNGKKAKTDL